VEAPSVSRAFNLISRIPSHFRRQPQKIAKANSAPHEHMSDISFRLEQKLRPALRAGDLTRCERTIADRLLKLKRSPFHIAAKLSIRNSPASVAKYCDRFFKFGDTTCAAYAEMNGFEINPDSWHFNVFAYKQYGGTRDFDWLSAWDDETHSSVEIRGLEKLQKIYASKAYESGEFREESAVASLLVVVKFQDLIRRAAPLMKHLTFPLLATAHEYDFIYEVRPKGLPRARGPARRTKNPSQHHAEYLAAEKELKEHMDQAAIVPRDKHITIYNYLLKKGKADTAKWVKDTFSFVWERPAERPSAADSSRLALKTLEETNNDPEAAITYLRKNGMAEAVDWIRDFFGKTKTERAATAKEFKTLISPAR
jgi:hypothetical protein